MNHLCPEGLEHLLDGSEFAQSVFPLPHPAPRAALLTSQKMVKNVEVDAVDTTNAAWVRLALVRSPGELRLGRYGRDHPQRPRDAFLYAVKTPV